ncbi:MAG TPA: glycosyltransferase family 39 protein [Terriglobales bacterium]|nr:glycosyltransferase family 39 protein [Terriglobales bacterium]
MRTETPSRLKIESNFRLAESSVELHWPSCISPVLWSTITALVLRLGIIFLFHTYQLQTRILNSKWIPAATRHFAFGFETGSIAGSLASGHGFSSPFGFPTGPTAWIAPVYPGLCVVVFKIFGLYTTASAIVILSLNCVFAALTCVPIYLLALRIFGKRTATLSIWTWAVCVFFMRWPTTWIWEVSLSALLLGVLVLLSLDAPTSDGQKKFVLLGCLWGFAAITNPSLLGAMPFLLAWIAFQRRRCLRPWFKPVLTVVLICFGFMLPWFLRNWVVMGHPVFIRDNFGFEFYLGNYHGSNGLGYLGKHPTQNIKQLRLYSQLGELGYVHHFKSEGLQFVREHPEEFALLTARRMVTFWDGGMVNYQSPGFWHWQSWELLCLAVPAFFGLALALGQRKRGALLLAFVVLLYPAPYYLTYAEERYRHAIEPELLILACYFACALWEHACERFRRQSLSPAAYEEAAR